MRSVFPPEVETDLVAAYFIGQPRGYFVDVGANEPKHHSQTWHLERSGWTGILIEPQPHLIEALRAQRTARVFSVACSSLQNAGRTMPFYVAGPYSSFDPQLMVAGVRPAEKIEVPVRTLDSVLIEAAAPKPIDFLSVDVEGHEVEVLSGFDFARWQPRLVLLEDHVGNLQKHRLMLRAGYRLIRRTGLNGWYVPEDRAGRLGWFGRWQILRKYYLALPLRMVRDAARRRRTR